MLRSIQSMFWEYQMNRSKVSDNLDLIDFNLFFTFRTKFIHVDAKIYQMSNRVVRTTWNDARRAQRGEEKDIVRGAYFDKSAFAS